MIKTLASRSINSTHKVHAAYCYVVCTPLDPEKCSLELGYG
jgi:hypothetical protein